MSCRPELHSLENALRSLRTLDPCAKEMSLVDLVLLACDFSEDATGIDDLVEGAIQSGAARILPGERDPMLVRTA